MAYGESNVTCPMTSRDARWSRLSHLFAINSRNKGYNHNSLGALRLTVGLVCYKRHVNITENLKNEITYQKRVVYVFRLRECDQDCLLTNLVL